MSELIQNEFQFLVDEHSFTAVRKNDVVLYQSESLVLTPAYDEKDGFDTLMAFPVRGAQEVSLDTVLSALGKDKAARFPSWTDAMKSQASFIKANLERLIALPGEIYGDCCKLQFSHGASQDEDWGGTIVINATAIMEENARLARILAYFVR